MNLKTWAVVATLVMGGLVLYRMDRAPEAPRPAGPAFAELTAGELFKHGVDVHDGARRE